MAVRYSIISDLLVSYSKLLLVVRFVNLIVKIIICMPCKYEVINIYLATGNLYWLDPM